MGPKPVFSMNVSSGCRKCLVDNGGLVAQSCPTLCGPMDCTLPGSWDFPGKTTEMVCHFLLQGIFPTQELNECLLCCQRRQWQPTPVLLPGQSHRQREPGGLPSMGSNRIGHDWSDLAAAAAAPVLQTTSCTAGRFFTTESSGIPIINVYWINKGLNEWVDEWICFSLLMW